MVRSGSKRLKAQVWRNLNRVTGGKSGRFPRAGSSLVTITESHGGTDPSPRHIVGRLMMLLEKCPTKNTNTCSTFLSSSTSSPSISSSFMPVSSLPTQAYPSHLADNPSANGPLSPSPTTRSTQQAERQSGLNPSAQCKNSASLTIFLRTAIPSPRSTCALWSKSTNGS